jgi:Zn-dependent peptidase ImmA (M78 family)
MVIETPPNVPKERIPTPAGYVRKEMNPGADAWDLVQRVWIEEPGLIMLPVDPFEISEKLGIKVWADDELPADVAGILRKTTDYKSPEIFLNDMDSRGSRRFTCAHVLGHYTRNVEIGRDGVWEIVEGRDFFRAELRHVEETYSTEFALEMLMPRIALREIKDSRTVASLAAFFGVTGEVMKFRLDQIGWQR